MVLLPALITIPVLHFISLETEKNFHQVQERLQSGDKIKVSGQEYRRGWLNSQARNRIQTPLFALDVEHDIHHTRLFTPTQIITRVRKDSRVWAGIDSTVDFKRNLKSRISIAAAPDNMPFTWHAAQARLFLDGSTQALTFDLMLPAFMVETVSLKDNRLHLSVKPQGTLYHIRLTYHSRELAIGDKRYGPLELKVSLGNIQAALWLRVFQSLDTMLQQSAEPNWPLLLTWLSLQYAGEVLATPPLIEIKHLTLDSQDKGRAAGNLAVRFNPPSRAGIPASLMFLRALHVTSNAEVSHDLLLDVMQLIPTFQKDDMTYLEQRLRNLQPYVRKESGIYRGHFEFAHGQMQLPAQPIGGQAQP